MRRLFFIHIPKTAGTSFREMMRGARPRIGCYPGRWQLMRRGGRYPPIQEYVRAAQRSDRGPYMYSGHYPYAIRQHLGADVSCAVVLRDPVERAVSNLLHLRRGADKFRRMPMSRLIRRRSVVDHHLSNLQTRFLQDLAEDELWEFRATRHPPPVDLDSALANLRRCEFVGITERFDESIALAEKTLGIELPARKHVNRGEKRRDDAVPAKLLDEIAAMNRADQVLYDAARELFDQRLAMMRERGSRTMRQARGN